MKCSFFVILLISISTLLFSAEPSAFGAGNLNSPNPYGLTSNEKVILETKNTLNKVTVKSNNQANELDSLRERIDGLQSIIESISRKAHNNKINIHKLNETSTISSKSSDEYDKRITEIVEKNRAKIEILDNNINEMSLVIDKMKSSYITKDEFNSLVNDVNNFKTLISKELMARDNTLGKKESLSSSDIYNRAKDSFDKKHYTSSIEDYEQLIKNNYKPAYAHYMIGEMNYRRKNYAVAISYFKKSSSLYSKASYMPSLMLHTAISMQKTGDSSNANTFFKAIVAKYPSSKEATKAKQYLD